MNYTSFYSLSQIEPTDKPTWLVMYNSDMLKIDTAIHQAQSTADGAVTAAGAAQSTADGAVSNLATLSGTVGSLGDTLSTAVGNINTINSLIGNGTPTTTDQTLIGAINELHADQGALSDLSTTDKSSFVSAINSVLSMVHTWIEGTLTAETDVTLTTPDLLYNEVLKEGIIDGNFSVSTISADGWIDICTIDKIVNRTTKLCVYRPDGEVRDCIITATATGSRVSAFLHTTDAGLTYRIPTTRFRTL